jgi:hypothetical protein
MFFPSSHCQAAHTQEVRTPGNMKSQKTKILRRLKRMFLFFKNNNNNDKTKKKRGTRQTKEK